MAGKAQAPYTPEQARAKHIKPKGYAGGSSGRAGSQVGSGGKGIEKCHCAGRPGMHGEMKVKGRNQ
jgi:hypothetical protein